LIVTEPVFPKHAGLVTLADAVRELLLLLMVNEPEPGQVPLLVATYLPALRPLNVVPEFWVVPFTVIVLASLLVKTTEPEDVPQGVFVMEPGVMVTAAGFVMVKVSESVHPLLSVTVTV
jgi:hypothetical protein